MLNIIKFSLMPILIAQGLWAKKNTPILPEAAGERMGTLGTGKLLRILVLGDSAAAGVGAQYQSEALSGQLCQQLVKAGHEVHWQLHACSGYTLEDIQGLVQNIPAQPFDFVFVSSGVNDILKQHSLKRWQRNIQQLYQQLQDKFSQPTIVFSAVPPLQSFTALPKTLGWYLGQWATRFNQSLAQTAQQLDALHFVHIEFPYDTAYLATDGFHPNPRSYSLWADGLLTYMQRSKLL